jgi:tetratricopeptide (TPR) repeat protein
MGLSLKAQVSLIGIVLFTSMTGSAQQRTLELIQQSATFDQPFDLPQGTLEQDLFRAQWDQVRPGHNAVTNGAVVSVEELQHKVPKQAIKEFKKGLEAYHTADYESALSHFQNTIQLDPDFADGHNDLGVVLAKLGNRDEAAEEFRRAVDLAPHQNPPLANYSICLYLLGHYAEAVLAARRALKNDSTLLDVHYALGASLFLLDGHRAEALESLELAAPKFPKARLLAAAILINMARWDDAAWELNEYLRSVPNSDSSRHEVEIQLAQLQK